MYAIQRTLPDSSLDNEIYSSSNPQATVNKYMEIYVGKKKTCLAWN